MLCALSALSLPASAEDAGKTSNINVISQNADFEYESTTKPGAPGGLTATKTADYIDLKWNMVTDSDGYLVKAVHPSGESSGMYYQYVTGRNYNGLKWNLNYDQTKNWVFYVAAYKNDAYGNKVIGNASKFTDIKDETTVTAPGAVEFTGYSKGTTTIELDWKALNCDGYEVDFKDQNAAEWKVLGTTSETHAKISKLNPGTTYYIRVRAYKNNGSQKLYGAYSEEKVIKTDSENVKAPADVNIKKIVTGQDSLRIYWDAVDCDGYQLYINKTGGSNDWEFIGNLSNKTLDYRFTGLEPEHTYWVSIAAFKYDSAKNPVYGNFTKKEAKTDKKGSSTETVATPAKVKINTAKCEVGYDNVRVYWDAVQCDGYQLYVNETGYKWEHVANVSGDTTSYRFTKLKPNHEYWFTVGAFNKLSNGNTVDGTFADNYHTTTKAAATVAKPPKTEFTSYSRTSNAIRLNWTAVNCDGYFIYRYNYTKKAWERVSIVKGGNITTKRFSGLQADTTYVYKIRSFKFNGSSKVYSEYSSPRSVTTKKK